MPLPLMSRLLDLSPSQTCHQLLQRLGALLRRPSRARWKVLPRLAQSRGSLFCLLFWRRWRVFTSIHVAQSCVLLSTLVRSRRELLVPSARWTDSMLATTITSSHVWNIFNEVTDVKILGLKLLGLAGRGSEENQLSQINSFLDIQRIMLYRWLPSKHSQWYEKVFPRQTRKVYCCIV